MFVYEKKLQYPVRITNPNPKLAAVIISQYGGPYTNKLRYSIKRQAPPGACLLTFYRIYPSNPAFFSRWSIFSALARTANAPTCTR